MEIQGQPSGGFAPTFSQSAPSSFSPQNDQAVRRYETALSDVVADNQKEMQAVVAHHTLPGADDQFVKDARQAYHDAQQAFLGMTSDEQHYEEAQLDTMSTSPQHAALTGADYETPSAGGVVAFSPAAEAVMLHDPQTTHAAKNELPDAAAFHGAANAVTAETLASTSAGLQTAQTSYDLMYAPPNRDLQTTHNLGLNDAF